MTRAFRVVGLGLVLLLAGCSSSKSSSTSSGGASGNSGTTGSGGTSGSSAAGSSGTSASGPAISSAPPAWVPPADCGGIGNLCPNLSGCGAKSECQLEGNVCIPSFDATTGLPARTATTPYCAAFTCMTFDEASCFCTGPAGMTEPACQSPAALAGLCGFAGSVCDDTACCSGYSCVDAGNGHKECQVTCNTNADCPDTGCCTDPNDVGINICSPKASCDNPCKKHGDTTCTGSATVASDCCNGSCNMSDNPAFAGCRPLCATNTDCDTGCCEPYATGGMGFCVDASFCSCGIAGAVCGPDSPACCDTASCGNVNGAYSCLQNCMVDSDCTSQCCSPLQGSDHGVCVPAAECAPAP